MTYYISTTGNNGNSGTSSSPWATLSYACSHATNSGDIIHVNAGTYTETSSCTLSPGVSIEGNGMTTTKIISNVAGSLFFLLSSMGTNGNQHISGIYFDGNNQTTSHALDCYGRSNVSVYNCTFINFATYGLRFFGNAQGQGESTSVTYATGISVHDSVITNCAYYQHGSGGGADIFMSCLQDPQFYNNVITQNRPLNGSGWNINGCGIKTDGWTRGVTIYNNTLIGNPTCDKENTTDSWDFAIEMWGDVGSVTEGIHIYGNTILNWEIDISGRVTQKGSYAFGCSIHDNFIGCLTLLPVTKFGIILEANTSLDDILIYHNHFSNLSWGVNFYVTNQTPYPIHFNNISIYYNIFDHIGQDADGSGVDGYCFVLSNSGSPTTTVSNLNIYNNVMLANVRTNSTVWSAIVFLTTSALTYNNFNIENNIITGFAHAPICNDMTWKTGSGLITGLNIKNNIFSGNGNGNAPLLTVSTSGYVNSGNLTTVPPFVSTSDYHLTAERVGLSVTLPTALVDYTGNVVKTPTIGAFEYSSSTPPVTSIPTVTTTSITSITTTTSSSGGNVTSDGGASVTAKGVCWAITSNPIVSGNHTSDGSGTGSYASSITGLSPNTGYHVRAYATNSVGTAYGSDVLFTSASASTGASTYYTDPATGVDDPARNGSNVTLQRYATPTFALARCKSGDTVHMNAGTYNLNSRIDVPVGRSIVGDGDATLIKTNFVAILNPDGDGDNDGLFRLGLNTDSISNGNQSISYLKIDGNNLIGTRAIAVNYRNNVEIHHCTIINILYSGVYFIGGLGHPWWYPISTSHTTGNSIHDCTILACTSGHIRWGSQDGLLIYNNILTGTIGDILACSWSKGVKIYNNIFTKSNGVSGTWNFFSELFFTEGGMEIYGNTFNGNATLDIVDVRYGSYSFGVKIYNNLWTNGAQAPTTAESIQAIDFEERGAIQGVYVYKNHFKNINTGVQVDGLATTTNKTYPDGKNIRMEDIHVYYNTFENVGNTTNTASCPVRIDVEGSTTNLVWDNINIDNNTMISGPTYKMGNGVLIQTGGVMSNINVRNNIIKGAAGAAISFSYKLPASITSGTFHVKNNLYYQNGTDGWTQSGVTIPGLDVAGNVIGNPAFVSGTDFHLTSSSTLAIGKGIQITSPSTYTNDYDGVLIANPPEIGAYEYKSSISTYQVNITVLPANATNNTVTWSVQNGTGSATITQTGLVTMISKGTVTAKATANDGSGVFGTLLVTF